ncbi:hypothetical protein BDA96_01G490100 [Sorghum bicolor]|uniref:NB-ARC domain-containing protein n=1 Tax=Sorghum bicolor TaxID=4558 RepID=A0A921V163_SORBI|nr:hypothetical protein BDA96_01G490100 [Sorghum bicolor]
MAWCSKTAMEMLSNAVLSDVVSRSVSFLLAKKREKQTTAAAQEGLLRRLCHLLLRSGTIVEEAERRHVTSPAMLRQLESLRNETLRGYYVLDAIRCQAAPRGADDGRKDEDEDDDEAAAVMSRHVFALSTFNPANYPPLHQQPYSAHLFIDRCMFGRHMEKERVMEFLLQTEEPPGAAAAATTTTLGVLPIVGPAHIGKSTLVEHVCCDERVRDHFSLILFYTRNDLKDEAVTSFRDNCVIRHRNEEAVGKKKKKLLIVIELLEDVNEETWSRLLHHSSKGSMPKGSRMIVTSRSEKIARLGTTPALRLKCLPIEAYWYFFRTVLFGSDDPGQYPELASLAMEMANLMQGSFMFANVVGAVVLRENFSARSWRRALWRTREYMAKNVSLFGEYPDDIKPTSWDRPRVTWSIVQERPDKYCMLYDIYERGSQEEVPEIPFSDMLARCAHPRGEYEILFWKSRIPPYRSYVCKCEIRDMSAS